MGTSASSNGPKSGVSLDPPWLDDIEANKDSSEHPDSDKEEISNNIQPDNVQQPVFQVQDVIYATMCVPVRQILCVKVLDITHELEWVVRQLFLGA